MKVSREGLVALARHEGIVVAPYRDVVGVWTWGVGHTAGAGNPDPATMPQEMPTTAVEFNDAVAAALRQFASDLESYERRVRDAVKVSVSQHEFDALVSFDFNTGGIFKAKLTKSLNSGDRDAAARGFMGWLRPEAIRGRRTAEQRLFETGDYGSGRIPIYGTDGRGKLRGVKKSLMPDELLSLMNEFSRGAIPATLVPLEVAAVAEDAGKPLRFSKTAWATGSTIAMSAWQAWQSADPIVQAVALGSVALLVVIFFERFRKSRLGKAAVGALGL